MFIYIFSMHLKSFLELISQNANKMGIKCDMKASKRILKNKV